VEIFHAVYFSTADPVWNLLAENTDYLSGLIDAEIFPVYTLNSK